AFGRALRCGHAPLHRCGVLAILHLAGTANSRWTATPYLRAPRCSKAAYASMLFRPPRRRMLPRSNATSHIPTLEFATCSEAFGFLLGIELGQLLVYFVQQNIVQLTSLHAVQ